MERIKILIYFCVLLISLSESQDNKCALKETCGACIRDINCVWCNKPFENEANSDRCASFNTALNRSWCAPEYILNPQSSGQTVNSIPLQSSTTAGKDAVQISPQSVKLRLRPGQEYELKFKYATAKDYPVDLYYIMDLSSSMLVHKQKLSELGNSLAQTMRTLTKNFRLGFGSFVDKVAEPFVGTHPDLLKNPCLKTRTKFCVPAYSFKNHLSLSESAATFTNEVKKADVSGNIDFPEGGFDALMQAIVCKEEIGWRPKSRHLIVFSADADFHIAGDGKLAGIVLPNDGKCHMENNEYTHGTKQDYPSIAQIAHTVREHNINLIFAIAKVSDRVSRAYEDLSRRIEGSTLGILSGDSSNVVEIIKDYYSKIVEGVKITDNSPNYIDVKYFSACRGSTEKETSKCDNLTVGAEVDFKAVIKVLKCPDDPNIRKQTFQIKPGALEETLSVEVELICECDCEKTGLPRAPECHNSGSLQCGICSCDPGKYGANCHCDGSTTTVEDASSCRMSESSEICSGLGTCKCNKCDCQQRPNKDERIYGKYCECTNYSCQRIAGALCSNNGVCDCGVCKCFDGYEGEACQCRNRNDTCIASKNGQVCNGHGTCECGYCKCDSSYYGQFCEGCPTCDGLLCDRLKDCVECITYKTGIFETEEACLSNCSSLDIMIVEKIGDEQTVDEKFCRGMDKDGCIFPFKYYYDDEDKKIVRIIAQKEKNCPSEIYVAGLVGYIIGSILLAGLILLLLWKGVTTVHDRREYAKFENERQNAKWTRGENPLFKNPTTTFANPTFNTGNTL